MEDKIDPGVGFIIDVKPGDRVRAGDLIATIHAIDEKGIAAGRRVLEEAIPIGDEPASCLPLVSRRVTSSGVETWVRPSI
jgi:thymidine phosphorylase